MEHTVIVGKYIDHVKQTISYLNKYQKEGIFFIIFF